MKNFPWSDAALSYMIGDTDHSHFFQQYHEKAHLLCHHQQANRYSDLINIDRIDEIIASSELPPESLRMARSDPPINRSNFTFSNGNIDRGAVIRHYQQGATIILPQFHLADSTLAHFCRALENSFSAQVQTNIYLTPPNNKGFNTHYDDHDVFVLQVSGKKKWKLYQRPIENPYRGEGFQANEHDSGEPILEFLLNAGDCVYIPRGLMHDASTEGDEPSLHITVGMLVKSWADFMLEALSEVAIRNPKFRKSLPPGFARSDYSEETAKDYFSELLQLFKEDANFDDIFELFVSDFVRTRGPNFRGAVTSELSIIKPTDEFVRRQNCQTLLRLGENGEPIIVSGGGDLSFSAQELCALEKVLAGEKVTTASFSESPEADAIDCIRKLLAFGVLEKA